MVPIINSSVLFNLNSLQLTYTDNTAYFLTYGIALTDVDGNLKATGPTGIFYNNISWTPPSIDLLAINTVNVPLPNVLGVLVEGNYTFDYKIRVLRTFDFLSIQNANNFTIAGNQTLYFSPGLIFTVTGGANAGTYTVVGVSLSGGNTLVNIVQVLPDITDLTGVIAFYNEYTNTQTFYVEDCAPVVKIQQTSDCDCSTLTSTDLTNYTVEVNGTFYAPTSIARVHTVQAPENPFTNINVIPDTVSSNAVIIVTPLWTQIWTSTVVTDLIYNIGGLIVIKTASGSANTDVVCTKDLCCAYACLGHIVDTYNSFKDNNLERASFWSKVLISALGEWMAYSVARTCGKTDTANERLKNLIAIAAKSGCKCCDDNTAEPVLVVGLCGAVGGVGSDTVVVSCGNGITVTPSVVGNTTTYTVCLDQAILGSLVGPPGAAGAAGAAGAIGLPGSAILYWNTNNLSTPTINTDVLMDTFVLPANSLITPGDEIEVIITGRWVTPGGVIFPQTPYRSIRIELNNSIFVIADTSSNANSVFQAKCIITRVSNTTTEGFSVSYWNSGAIVQTKSTFNFVTDFANNQNIHIYINQGKSSKVFIDSIKIKKSIL